MLTTETNQLASRELYLTNEDREFAILKLDS